MMISLAFRAGVTASVILFMLGCAPSSPCRSGDARRQLARFSHNYAGHWVVTRGDSLTLPDPTLGDRFRLERIVLDTDTVSIARQCLYRGQLVFVVPRADTLAVSWFGVPEHATVFGWPAEGPVRGYQPDAVARRFPARRDPVRRAHGRADAPGRDGTVLGRPRRIALTR